MLGLSTSISYQHQRGGQCDSDLLSGQNHPPKMALHTNNNFRQQPIPTRTVLQTTAIQERLLGQVPLTTGQGPRCRIKAERARVLLLLEKYCFII
jgi:ABC-type antimicrobial peptide transport system ATPase subunit